MDALGRGDRALVLTTIARLRDGPYGNPDVKVVVNARWPGTVRVRCGPFRVLALVLPEPRVILFTCVFRKKRASDYEPALRRHDRRVAAQGPPLEDYLG